MKKMILAFDGTNFSEGAFEFARKLNEIQPVFLVGAFLPQAQPGNLWSYADYVASSYIPLPETDGSGLVQGNIARFRNLCRENNIEYRVHTDFYDFVLPELKKESGFADLLIIGSDTFYSNMNENSSNSYLDDALHGVKCPVLLVPEKFDFPESVILTYDGSDNSVFAIKQFAYLFPELTNRKTLLVYANDDAEENFPDKTRIEELVSRHFKNITPYKLEADPKKYFSSWVLEKKSPMLISGSYGRSGLSQLFKKSFIKNILSYHRLPVFIAHK